MLLLNVIPPDPEQPILLGGEGCDQSVFGLKQAIEARLRYAGSLDDRVDANGADALAGEQFACRREDALAGAYLAFGGAPRRGRAATSISVCSSRSDFSLDKVTDLSVK
jgi:hypothetical protein